MKSIKLVLLFFFIFPFLAHSQSSGDSVSQEKTQEPKLILKWAPLSLMDIYSAVQFALEYRVGGRGSVQAEAGYIFPLKIRASALEDDYENMNGYRIRTEYRYYLIVKDRIGGFYLAPEFFFIKLNFDETDVVRVPFNSFEDFYYQEKLYDVQKTVLGYHFKAGYQKLVTDRFVIDFYAGLGARHVSVISDRPFDRWETENNSFFTPNGRGESQRVSLSAGIKFGFLL